MSPSGKSYRVVQHHVALPYRCRGRLGQEEAFSQVRERACSFASDLALLALAVCARCRVCGQHKSLEHNPDTLLCASSPLSNPYQDGCGQAEKGLARGRPRCRMHQLPGEMPRVRGTLQLTRFLCLQLCRISVCVFHLTQLLALTTFGRRPLFSRCH